MSVTGGNVASVTEASSGIGRATARAFAREGYVVVIADVGEDEGRAAAAECQAERTERLFVRCDVSSKELDVAFNNAGIERMQAHTHECTAANFDRIAAVNLRGVGLCMREEVPLMLDRPGGGAIVNCSSVAWLIGLPNIAAYVAATTGGVVMLPSAVSSS